MSDFATIGTMLGSDARAAQETSPNLFPDTTTDGLSMGEMALWRAVVEQALRDATFGLHRSVREPNQEPDEENHVHARLARRWLLSGGEDFRTVCDLADLDPTAVRAAAVRTMDACDAKLSGLAFRAA